MEETGRCNGRYRGLHMSSKVEIHVSKFHEANAHVSNAM